MLSDGEARIRRRAALAVGRTGLREATPALVGLLKDAEPEVRQMAAFAIGLLADPGARAPLVAALADPSPLMKGSAAEALGLIGDAETAPPVAAMASDILASGALNTAPADALEAARDTPQTAFRLALQALVRLKAFEALASVVLDASGQPKVRWWPVASALQQFEDRRALPALLALLGDPHPYTKAFAAKGLGAMNDPAAAAALLPFVGSAERPVGAVGIEAIRSLGRLQARAALPALLSAVQSPRTDPIARLEALRAIGAIGGDVPFDALIDLLGDSSPPIRSAAIAALARRNGEDFITVLSGLEPDAEWSVRAALASVLGGLPPDVGLPRLRAMLADPDSRVVAPVLAAIAKLAPADAATLVAPRIQDADPVVRAAAATAIGVLKPSNGVALLADAYGRGAADTTYVARGAVAAALAAFPPADVVPVLTTALADPDWAVRLRAAMSLKALAPSTDVSGSTRPAPSRRQELYSDPQVISPSVSVQAFIETTRGSIQIELAMLDAPLTVRNFMTLARAHFFDGQPIHRVVPDFVVQAGDPRGDGEGGPGYSIRDELNQHPYLRGTVGMALDWADTGGSQFFITHAPQPQLDTRYTVFGRVLSGMDVVDAIQQWDVIRRVTIWDGTISSADSK